MQTKASDDVSSRQLARERELGEMTNVGDLQKDEPVNVARGTGRSLFKIRLISFEVGRFPWAIFLKRNAECVVTWAIISFPFHSSGILGFDLSTGNVISSSLLLSNDDKVVGNWKRTRWKEGKSVVCVEFRRSTIIICSLQTLDMKLQRPMICYSTNRCTGR